MRAESGAGEAPFHGWSGSRLYEFPGSGSGAPAASLSARAAGSMRFRWNEGNDNRLSYFESLGYDPHDVLSVELVHSKRVLACETRGALAGMTGDGIITRNHGLQIALTAADCMPIWVWDPRSGAFGVLHSGWEGTGILLEAARSLAREYGTRPSELRVILGPCIRACCYAVDRARAELFASRFGPDAARRSGDRYCLDLPAANLALARGAGIEHIAVIDACTCCDDRYGSFRREGPLEFTPMAAVAGYPR